MIYKLRVDNFKALNKFEMEFRPFTVIVGNNTTGKSTILQAIDFLTSMVSEDFYVILERRGWTVSDIRSKLRKTPSDKMTFECFMHLWVGDHEEDVRWKLVIELATKSNQMELFSEEIVRIQGNEEQEMLRYHKKEKCYLVSNQGEQRELFGITELQSSFLKLISISGESRKEYATIACMKEFLRQSDSFDLLSPDKMRMPSRGNVSSIGHAGEKISSFVKSLDERHGQQLEKRMQDILGDKFTDLRAQTKGKPEWMQLLIRESYSNKSMDVTAKNMSDGMLRLLAFLSICEIDKKHVVMLLDEIENGINVNYAEKIMGMLKSVFKENGNQLIVTTHSTNFLDYVDKEDIIYLYRETDTGNTRAVALFSNAVMKDKAEYLYPGEVFLNMSNEEIERVLNEE